MYRGISFVIILRREREGKREVLSLSWAGSVGTSAERKLWASAKLQHQCKTWFNQGKSVPKVSSYTDQGLAVTLTGWVNTQALHRLEIRRNFLNRRKNFWNRYPTGVRASLNLSQSLLSSRWDCTKRSLQQEGTRPSAPGAAWPSCPFWIISLFNQPGYLWLGEAQTH